MDCAGGEVLDPAVEQHRVDRHLRAGQAERIGVVHRRAYLGGGHQRLGRHAVGQHAGAADPVALDDRHLRTEFDSDERRLVACGTAADDRNAHHRRSLSRSCLSNAAALRLAKVRWWPSTPPTAPTSIPSRCGPDARIRRPGTGWIVGWRLTFGGEDLGWEGALATVVEDPAAQTSVMLYDVTAQDETTLDEWEGAGQRHLPQDPGAGARPSTATCSPGSTCWAPTRAAAVGALPRLMADAAESAGAPDDYVTRPWARPCRSATDRPSHHAGAPSP